MVKSFLKKRLRCVEEDKIKSTLEIVKCIEEVPEIRLWNACIRYI